MRSLAFLFAIVIALTPVFGERPLRVPRSKILREAQPEYPAEALDRRITGVVMFQALIGKDGAVKDLRLLSGHPLLRDAALQAARKNVYEPMIWRGEPSEVATIIEVHFRLDAAGRPLPRQSRQRQNRI